jgi:hypothetical protein
MKISDAYNAKFKIWAAHPKVHPLPRIIFPFKIPSQKFSSYEDFNKWKSELIAKIAKHGGIKWKK